MEFKMINISEDIADYIRSTYTEIVRTMMYKAFSLMEEFDLNFYEDEFLDLMSLREIKNSDEISDLFLVTVLRKLTYIINEHGITIAEDCGQDLEDLTNLCSGISLLLRRTDFEDMSYVIEADVDDKEKFIRLITRFENQNERRLNEVIDRVNPKLILAIRMYIEDNYGNTPDVESLNLNRLNYINNFRKFINNTNCLGLRLYKDGFINSTLDDIEALSKVNLHEYISEVYLKDRTQAALDLLSVLVITKGYSNNIPKKLSSSMSYFTNNTEMMTSLTYIINGMMGDFNSYLSALDMSEAQT